ncbi:hypothetical protein TUM4644_10420 [Shewanella colwelliana]|uniref:hypothetical protein n=1 Tax=Shewanella colwelliana TaxID=23 RepID=UPI001BC09B0F|nr:hypothetical protein [Shewanella colwelliana]MDX1283127.1 hypothetical protein [Shewanella colwelliana]GIU20614.1 hypothetical protein TUM4644_10420 [Shewanella colwelliana]
MEATLTPANSTTSATPAIEAKHSGLGIASFVLSIVSLVLTFGLLIVAGVLEATTPGGMNEESIEAIVVGLLLFAFIGTALIATGLGIAGLCQKQRKKIFAILGTIFSLVTVVSTVSLISFGMTID